MHTETLTHDDDLHTAEQVLLQINLYLYIYIYK